MLIKKLCQDLLMSNICFDQLESFSFQQILDILMFNSRIIEIAEVVQTDNLMFMYQSFCQMRADETGIIINSIL